VRNNEGHRLCAQDDNSSWKWGFVPVDRCIFKAETQSTLRLKHLESEFLDEKKNLDFHEFYDGHGDRGRDGNLLRGGGQGAGGAADADKTFGGELQ
jgi:hypothetical protein